ncbi:polysaccharide deacetylase family protein [Paenibacillus glycanilyticus]|uniref:polysaccharide deacetylase family protein n=1 Tax=Paenibacillus glycanilyticus TaxID=126569 RepID=UPI00203B16AD|nr:polysaccharide deacetylase family protein [Paenibacillus glycanilyticus]MCM3630994.1 polysaccharide deacetylase family protein [Paenibacillus glycanilyticus]
MDQYETQMSSELEVIPKLLKLFEEQRIHATWAVVGLMFCEHANEMMGSIPQQKPTYENQNLSPYPYIEDQIFAGGQQEAFHFAPGIIKTIQKTKNQSISTHTFSHYYCLEEGQTVEQFSADIAAAIRIAEKKGFNIQSIVFPRNQFNEKYLGVLQEQGIASYRGNPDHWIYRKGYSKNDSILLRVFRLMDTYFNLSGHNCYSVKESADNMPANIPASHFLRPYSGKLRFLERLRLKRILSSMTHAAKHGLVYHLWWHPYNLARNPEENWIFMKKIIDHFQELNKQYGMESMSMEDLTAQVTSVKFDENRLSG